MSTRLTQKGREKFGLAGINWTSDTIKGMLLKLDGTSTDVAIKAITAASNATPIVVTSASHGFSNGDIVVIRGVVGNTAANGTWAVANVATNTFELTTTTPEALNAVGNGAYTSGGCVINLTLAANFTDVDGCQVGTSTSAFTSPTDTNGVLDAADPTFSAVPNGSTSHAWMVYKDTGTGSTSTLIFFGDGLHQVVINKAVATSDTSISCEVLESAITNPTSMIFSSGKTEVTNASVAQFARSIGIAAASGNSAIGHTADVASTASPNFPISGNGGSITLTLDNAANKLLKL